MAWTTPRTWSDAELENAAIFNTHVRDNFNAVGEHKRIVKSNDETVNNSTTLQDDAALFWTPEPSSEWVFEMMIHFSSATTPDLKCAWTIPSPGSASQGTYLRTTGAALTMSAVSSLTTTVTADGAGATIQPLYFWGRVQVGSGASGNIQFQWAQNTLEVSDTIVYGQSWLVAHRIDN